MLASGLALATCLTPSATAAGSRPSFLVITTDDQTAESLGAMPATLGLLAAEGTTFTNAVASFPLCAPSRATFLTARYAHNHGVRSNDRPSGGYDALDHARTLPFLLQGRGYYTAHVGKYLNGYGQRDPAEIPPGYDAWFALVDPGTYRMYGYTINDQGAVRQFGHDEASYQTDVLAAQAESVIRGAARSGRPFFVHVAPLAPHDEVFWEVYYSAPPRPAPRHVGLFDGVPMPISPAFNEADVSDKPPFVQAAPPLDAAAVVALTDAYRARLASLRAVDELIARLVAALAAAGVLDDTVIVFTSDNGYLLGEHRLGGKIMHYGPSITVPLVVRGPRFPRSHRQGTLVSTVDLASTIALLSGGARPRDVDGRRLDRLARSRVCDRRNAVLLEGLPASAGATDPGMLAVGVRTQHHRYTEYASGARELYDLRADPFELENRAGDPDPAIGLVRTTLSETVTRLRGCVGTACRRAGRLKVPLTPPYAVLSCD